MGADPGAAERSRKILARVAAQLGGTERLAALLGVGPRMAAHYLTGREPIPDSLLLKAMDIMLEHLPPKAGDSSK